MTQAPLASVVATHRIIRAQAPGQQLYSIGDGNFDNILKAMDLYYKVQSRYRKCALMLVMVALSNGMEPIKFIYHRETRVGTLHVLDHKIRTPDGQPWPTALDLKED